MLIPLWLWSRPPFGGGIRASLPLYSPGIRRSRRLRGWGRRWSWYRRRSRCPGSRYFLILWGSRMSTLVPDRVERSYRRRGVRRRCRRRDHRQRAMRRSHPPWAADRRGQTRCCGGQCRWPLPAERGQQQCQRTAASSPAHKHGQGRGLETDQRTSLFLRSEKNVTRSTGSLDYPLVQLVTLSILLRVDLCQDVVFEGAQ